MADDILEHLAGTRQPPSFVYCLHFTPDEFSVFCRWMTISSVMVDYLQDSACEAPSADIKPDFIARRAYADQWLDLSRRLLPVLESMTRKWE